MISFRTINRRTTYEFVKINDWATNHFRNDSSSSVTDKDDKNQRNAQSNARLNSVKHTDELVKYQILSDFASTSVGCVVNN